MTITQLTYFVAVAEELSLTRVAARYHISQPAVSAAVRDIEKEYGIALFERRHNDLYLTPTGNSAYFLAKSLLEHYDTFCHALASESKKQKVLSLAVTPYIATVHLADILLYTKQNASDLTINIQEDFVVNMVHMLKNNLIDAACFACRDEYKDKDLNYIPVGFLYLSCCASPDILDLPQKSITANDLKGVPLVFQRNPSLLNTSIQDYFSKDQVLPNILFYANQISTIISLVKKGVAASIMPSELVADDDIIVYDLQNFDRSVSTIYFVYKKKTSITDELLHIIQAYFKLKQGG